MSEPIAGKFLLEILTKGMYSNPKHIYREYIQNSVDSFDKAVEAGVLTLDEAEIHIAINKSRRMITIRDNGLGIPQSEAKKKLLSIGDSEKDGDTQRGFRGIGRLAGLAYADEVQFITSAMGETTRTVMACDCVRMQQLLQKSNKETSDVMETFFAISNFNQEKQEEANKHYFEVRLMGVPEESGLLDEQDIARYLAETAPVDFDSQQFTQARKIRETFEQKGFPIACYKIFRGDRRKPIYKLYARSLSTGKQERTKNKDFVRDVEFVYDETSDGTPSYFGWLAITDFTGIISDEAVQGIRFRKGNILVGNAQTFVKFFPSEGHNANRMFAGEIHVLHAELTPNSQRDNFEPNDVYNEMKTSLTAWAGSINKKYRRGTSDANSALRKLAALNDEQKELEERINSGAISSDEKREQIADQLERITKSREKEAKKVRKAQEMGVFDPERNSTVEDTLAKTETATQKATKLNTEITNADYATKNDLPSSYSREERKLYQRIISIIDSYFVKDPPTAEALRKMIKTELSVKKK